MGARGSVLVRVLAGGSGICLWVSSGPRASSPLGAEDGAFGARWALVGPATRESRPPGWFAVFWIPELGARAGSDRRICHLPCGSPRDPARLRPMGKGRSCRSARGACRKKHRRIFRWLIASPRKGPAPGNPGASLNPLEGVGPAAIPVDFALLVGLVGCACGWGSPRGCRHAYVRAPFVMHSQMGFVGLHWAGASHASWHPMRS